MGDVKVGEHYQFQRLGYFNVDDDSTSKKIVFNKTVGLRDTWAKVKPQQNNNQQKQPQQERPALSVIQQLGKKYTNLPEEKRLKSRSEILKLAEKVTYEELEPLFGTAAKKVGTRIAVTLVLGVLLNNGQEKNEAIGTFITKALEDKNELLVEEATKL